ncbi:MAG: DUF4421 family protein [Saonia sp.]
MRANTIFLGLCLMVNLTFGQKSKESDSTAILSYVDKIIIKVNLDTQTDAYRVYDRSTNTRLELVPNSSLRIDLSLDYEFMGASIGFSPKFLPGNDDDAIKGKSSFTDYRFRFFLGNWTQEVQYASTQGYYVENTGDFLPNWIEGEDAYLQFPEFRVRRWGGSTSYVLNPKFSLRNVVYQTEWQRKSAGSFVPTINYSYNRFSNLVEGSKMVENAIDVQLAASYYFTWAVHQNWFISQYISPGLGMRFSAYEEEAATDLIERNNHLIATLDGGMQLGYSSRKVIFGLNMNFDFNWYNEDKTTSVVNNKLYGKLYFGYRFNAPKMVQKPFNWMNKKLGQ